MIIILESTSEIVEVNNVPARIWEGETDSGIKVYALITRIAVGRSEDTEQFDKELLEQKAPSVIDVFPLRMII